MFDEDYTFLEINTGSFISDGQRVSGVCYNSEYIIAVVKSSSPWKGGLTIEDKHIIHEMAHAMKWYSGVGSIYKGEGHNEEWAAFVRKILEMLFPGQDVKQMTMDIVAKYGIKPGDVF